MNGSGSRSGMGWGARLLVALVLVLTGAGAAVWALAHYPPAARFLGIVPRSTPVNLTPKPVVLTPPATNAPARATASEDARITALEQRLSKVERATQQAQGSAGRADSLVVAFAARRAIDRGVALGYLENLLAERFGAQHPAAVATIVTASHQPVRLNDLVNQYEALGHDLRQGGPEDSWWTNVKRELGTIVEVHRADQPAVNTDARYNRALLRIRAGDVDQALVETMRLPGASRAGTWVANARRYITAHRALDEIESAALLPAGPSGH